MNLDEIRKKREMFVKVCEKFGYGKNRDKAEKLKDKIMKLLDKYEQLVYDLRMLEMKNGKNS